MFGMHVRVATGGTTFTWSTSSRTHQFKKFADINNALGWLGLGFVIFGTMLPAIATLARKSAPVIATAA